MTQNVELADLPAVEDFPALSEVQHLLHELSELIRRLEVRCARNPSVRLLSLIEAHEATTRAIMDGLGTTLSEFVAAGPPPHVLAQVRAAVTGRLRAWSSTSPVFYHVLHTPRKAFDGFEITELLLDSRPGGADVASQILDHYYLNTVTAHAYRQRIAQLIEQLASLTAHYARTNQVVRILDLHTGAARELIALAKEPTFAHKVELTCVDTDASALRRANQRLNDLLARRITTCRADPRAFTAAPATDETTYDIIYATTLFDQLKDASAARLIADSLRHLRPGGTLLFGNFAPTMPAGEHLIIEWVMNWVIRCRSEENLRHMFASQSVTVQDLKFLYEPFHASILTVATGALPPGF